MRLRTSTILAATAVTLVAAGAHAAPGDSLQEATQRGANYLVTDVYNFARGNTCQACHRQGAALYGLSVAHAAGYAINVSDTNGLGYIATRAINDQRSDGGYLHDPGWQLRNSKTSYAAMGVAGYNAHVNTRYSSNVTRMADWIVGSQTVTTCTLPSGGSASCGYWAEEHGSYATTYGNLPTSVRMMITLAAAKPYGTVTQVASWNAALERASNWLRSLRASSAAGTGYHFQEIAYNLLGLDVAGAASDDADLVHVRDRLLGLANASGGWGAVAGHASNAYTTGLALYALCQVGVRLSNTTVASAADWLNATQTSSGYWSGNGFGTIDVPTTFAMLGLGCFGTLGVDVSAVGSDREQIASNSASTQTRTFTIRVANTGAFAGSDAYNMSVAGALPGWSATLSQQVVTVESGASVDLELTVVAPANVAPATPVTFSVRAQSQSSAGTNDTQNIVVFTDPPPPVTGLPTVTSITAGNGQTITNRLSPYGFSAQVRANGAVQSGPGIGVVTFYVAGVPVAADTDADGDGTFTVSWTPGVSWNTSGTQDLRAIYSGVDRPDPQSDLLSSLAAGTVVLNLAADSDGDGIPNDIESGVVGSNPAVADTDGDGCSDGQEYYINNTNPLVFDMDGDGTGDCGEIAAGTNPNLNDSYPDQDQDAVSDGSDYFPCQPDRTAVAFAPGENTYGQLMFEDNWPLRGDLDFNDAIIAYHYDLFFNADNLIREIVLTLEPRAHGADYRNGIALRLPVSSTSLGSATRRIGGGEPQSLDVRTTEPTLVVDVVDNLRSFFAGRPEKGMLNTVSADPAVDGQQVVVTLTFSNPIRLDLKKQPFDIFFARTETPSHEIHLPMFDGTSSMNLALFGSGSDGSTGDRFFVDYKGLPFLIALPALAPWPTEGTRVDLLFPGITEFARSGGVQNASFYSVGIDARYAYPPSLDLSMPALLSPAPQVVPDRSCTPVRFGG